MMAPEREQRLGSAANYLMIKSLYIKNFRCFQDARVDGLRRVNIVVGKNATGKTVLLESLFLAAGGSPLIVLKLRQMRGMGDNVQLANTTLPRLWEDLFFGFDTHLSIEIDSIGTAQDSNSVFISDIGTGSLTLPLKGGEEAAV